MHRAKQTSFRNWSYRGGSIEHASVFVGRSNNWAWQVCGVSGWVNNKAQAKAKIDSLLAQAKEILEGERT
jgi:hypothetical protein